MADHPYVIADVFTDTPLQGNQLAVFTDATDLSGERMQQTARELNLSETVFVLPAEQGGDARVRIFTPASELPFAGHPILGTAFVLGERDGGSRIVLETRAAMVPVDLERDGERVVFGRMQQPIPTVEPYERAAELLRALGVERSGLPVEAYRNGPRHVYVELPSEEAVAALRPDFGAFPDDDGLGVSTFAGAAARWKTRMFAPSLGVVEDPATGSAAGPLALHLARHGRIAFGDDIEIRQGAEIGRPSLLHARVEGSADRVERIVVGGSAVIVARGTYRLT
ncbi:MAG: phenazine biosynthesis protein PhzF family [Solirubrobacterales bacterium]|nr:phenazine biosynthesis protein PhzF family [Solirubrobacterales bacterium]